MAVVVRFKSPEAYQEKGAKVQELMTKVNGGIPPMSTRDFPPSMIRTMKNEDSEALDELQKLAGPDVVVEVQEDEAKAPGKTHKSIGEL